MALKITAASHLDHDLTPAHLAFILRRYADRTAFFIETITLPESMPAVPCGLYGPTMGDDLLLLTVGNIHMAPRPPRQYPSRLVDLPPRPSRLLTVIAGPHEGDDCVLYTAFGGPLAPKEPGDPTLSPEQRQASKDFWDVHALAAPDIDPS